KRNDKNMRVYDGNVYHDYFRKIPFMKLKKILDSNNITLTHSSIFVAGSGNGTDIYYLNKMYDAKVYACDIAYVPIEAAVKSFHNTDGFVASINKLPFKDCSFDYAYVAASLHHLCEPLCGLYELLRVSKKGVIVIEPNDSFFARIAVLLGIAHQVEEAGNYVYRFNAKEVVKITKSLFCKCSIVRFFALHKIAKNRLHFMFLKFLNTILNMICPSQGNYIIFIIQKST
ncbi:MAG: class I SAM-dependent methyltransferase, partial [Candidatus Omnitrophica bacterium]|nr:class I SAM-dependent methyltransferase [Candidatus Omnitrophota bacterium]